MIPNNTKNKTLLGQEFRIGKRFHVGNYYYEFYDIINLTVYFFSNYIRTHNTLGTILVRLCTPRRDGCNKTDY